MQFPAFRTLIAFEKGVLAAKTSAVLRKLRESTFCEIVYDQGGGYKCLGWVRIGVGTYD
jgi:hypothetical protein